MGTEEKKVRKPQQKRGKQTAEKILDTALRLFCEKGYYHTTTNEIAKEAGISIGSLYSYYSDKDTIFLEILKQYNDNFLSVFEKMKDKVHQALYVEDKRAWLSVLLHDLVTLHISVKTLNRELKGLYYLRDDVREIMDQQTQKIQTAVFEILSKTPGEIDSNNLSITALLTVDFLSAVVDRIVLDETLSKETRQEIMAAGIRAVCKQLYQ